MLHTGNCLETEAAAGAQVQVSPEDSPLGARKPANREGAAGAPRADEPDVESIALRYALARRLRRDARRALAR